MLNVICCQFSSHWLTEAFIGTLLNMSLLQLTEVKMSQQENISQLKLLIKPPIKQWDYFKIESFGPQGSRFLSVKRGGMGRFLCADWDNGAGKSPSDLCGHGRGKSVKNKLGCYLWVTPEASAMIHTLPRQYLVYVCRMWNAVDQSGSKLQQ